MRVAGGLEASVLRSLTVPCMLYSAVAEEGRLAPSCGLVRFCEAQWAVVVFSLGKRCESGKLHCSSVLKWFSF
jgi:hypothetical protein